MLFHTPRLYACCSNWNTWANSNASLCMCVCVYSVTSVVSESLWPSGLRPAHLLCPRTSQGKNTGVSCHSFLQGTLAWKIPWMEEPGRLQSMRSLSWTQLSDFTFTFHSHALEKEMAIHSSVLAWRVPGMGEPGGRPSIGLHRVKHDWSNLAAAASRGSSQQREWTHASCIAGRYSLPLSHQLRRLHPYVCVC